MNAKIAIVAFLGALAAFALGEGEILHQSKYFTVREYSPYEGSPSLASGQTDEDFTYKIVDVKPTNQTNPPDNGGNYGDMNFVAYEDGDLMSRDTIINKIYNTTVEITYYKEIPGYNATTINVLNFGRERGRTVEGLLHHVNGIWMARFYVSANKSVRIFVESYGKKLKW